MLRKSIGFYMVWQHLTSVPKGTCTACSRGGLGLEVNRPVGLCAVSRTTMATGGIGKGSILILLLCFKSTCYTAGKLHDSAVSRDLQDAFSLSYQESYRISVIRSDVHVLQLLLTASPWLLLSPHFEPGLILLNSARAHNKRLCADAVETSLWRLEMNRLS